MSYNLDNNDNESESFDFVLGGNTYSFRYPTTEEVTELTKFKQPNGMPDVEKMMGYIYDFITPATEGAPSIKDAMNKSRIQKFKAFQQMMIDELGLQVQGV